MYVMTTGPVAMCFRILKAQEACLGTELMQVLGLSQCYYNAIINTTAWENLVFVGVVLLDDSNGCTKCRSPVSEIHCQPEDLMLRACGSCIASGDS